MPGDPVTEPTPDLPEPQDHLDDGALRRLGGLIARENAPVGLLLGGRYEVLKRLPRTDAAERFLACDTAGGGRAVIRIFPAGRPGPGAAPPGPPGVLATEAAGTLPDGRAFAAARYAEGLTLAELVGSGEERARVLGIVAAACEAVAAAHAAGLFHGHLAAANVVSGVDGRVYVTDWGPGPGDAAADVKGLGAVLHEALTGSAPGGGRPSERDPSVPAALEELCERALGGGLRDAGELGAELRRRAASGPGAGKRSFLSRLFGRSK